MDSAQAPLQEQQTVLILLLIILRVYDITLFKVSATLNANADISQLQKTEYSDCGRKYCLFETPLLR